MKANELTIGDWVRSPKNADGDFYAAQVCEIKQGGEYYYCDIPGPDGNDSIRCDDLSPVPLTPEILEKNGFEKSEFGWYNRKIDEWEIEIYIGRIEAFVKINKGVLPHINNTDCRFLHQLQHALRFCGIKKEIVL